MLDKNETEKEKNLCSVFSGKSILLGMARTSPEHVLQIQLIERARLELVPRFPELAGPHFRESGALRLFAVPNGGLRNIREAVRLKMEGVQRGVPDLCLPIPRGGYCGAWLELKAPGGTISPEQEDWLEFLHGQGYRVGVRWNVADAFQFLDEYLSLDRVPIAGRPAADPVHLPGVNGTTTHV